MMKKITALMLAMLMLFVLAACGKKEDNNSSNPNNALHQGFVVEGEDAVTIGVPETKLDPDSVYSNLTYTPQMFYGDYRLLGGDEAEEKYGNEMEYFELERSGKKYELTKIPYGMQAGKNTLTQAITLVEGYDWMQLSYLQKTETGNHLYWILGAYTIEGNTLIVKPLDSWNVDEENNKITYSFTDIILQYEFEFRGRNVTLSSEGVSVELTTGLDPVEDTDYFQVDNYLSPESESIDGLDHISFRYAEEESNTRLYLENADDESVYNAAGVLKENGVFTLTVPWETGTKTYQYVYFYGGNDGLTLTDGTNTYYYNDSYSDRNKNTLNDYLSEDETGKLDEMTDAELEAIVEKKENLMTDLAAAFNEAGIKVTVDEKTGELAMDSSVLFGGDSAVLTDEGKAFLNKFLDAYTSIVFSEKYEGFVSKTMVEGHTAPVSGSTYESGLPLSEERANNVKNYCVSSETGVDITKLAAALEAVGYSNSKPVYDASGNVDMAASRRVSFRFIINLES